MEEVVLLNLRTQAEEFHFLPAQGLNRRAVKQIKYILFVLTNKEGSCSCLLSFLASLGWHL